MKAERGVRHVSRKTRCIIKDTFNAAGITAQITIDGTMGPDEGKRIILGFAWREYTVLVSVALLTFDLICGRRLGWM